MTRLRVSLINPGSTRGVRRAAAPLSTTITIEKLNTVSETMLVIRVLRMSRALSGSVNPDGKWGCSEEAMDVVSKASMVTARMA